jgi:hypothetical protein
MSEQAPPPPSLEQRPRQRRTFLWVGLSVLIPLVSLVVIAGLVLQVSGWTTFHQASSSMLPTLLISNYFFRRLRRLRRGASAATR